MVYPKKIRFDHIGIQIKDMPRAVEFMKENFGWGYSDRKDSPYRNSQNGWCMLVPPGDYGTIIEFFHRPDLLDEESGKIVHLCFCVNDLEDTHRRMIEKGLEPSKIETASSGDRYFHCNEAKCMGMRIEFIARSFNPF